MKRVVFFVVVVLAVLPATASARGGRFRSYPSSGWGSAPPAIAPAAPSSNGYSYRAYSHQTRENRPIAVQRAPYSIESNVWRADRKMMQTYWYRD